MACAACIGGRRFCGGKFLGDLSGQGKALRKVCQQQTPQRQHIRVAQQPQQGFGCIGPRQQGDSNHRRVRSLGGSSGGVPALDQRGVQLGGQCGALVCICNAHAYVAPVGQTGSGLVKGFELGRGLCAKALHVRGQRCARALGAVADGRWQRQAAGPGSRRGIIKRRCQILRSGWGRGRALKGAVWLMRFGLVSLWLGHSGGGRRWCGRIFGGVRRAAGRYDRRQGKSSQHGRYGHAEKQCTHGPHGLIFLSRWSGQSCAPWA